MRLIIRSIVNMCVKSLLIAAITGVIISVIGYVYNWSSLIAYSNALFIAGSLLFIAGAFSRYAAGQGLPNLRLFHAESLRNMSSSELANFIVAESSSPNIVILGLLSGILLMLLSVILAYI